MKPTLPIPVSFDQRLQQVKTEIERRIAQKQPANQYAMRARLWVSWLAKNLPTNASSEVSHV
ncbi:MAG: hypothetical protein WAQ53_13595 [Thiofilum sp.]|uniref:hypothetical protein n=1 Tax=Thiofilum sp. TaxID=2212733 RepID=UPI0025FDCFFE|nr:hypothetical protein [Thiofilum sp.]MBK8453609.1 hypothetical protein [Thiofilum sp.]